MPGDDITIVLPTHRPEPRFDWFADSLARQLGDDAPEVIVVDGLYSTQRGEAMAAAVAGRFPFRHVPAKPNAFNGPHRRTRRRQYTALSSARNTGAVYATRPYLVYADDLAVLMPGWWEEVCRAAADEVVVGGAYQKHRAMQVRDGVLTDSTLPPAGIDVRWGLGDDARPVEIFGGQLYGCSFGVPREVLFEVNGSDELCNSVAGEDYDLGIRLGWTGEPILYNRRMLTIESDDDHAQDPVMHRLDVSLDEPAYMALLRAHGVERRSTDGRFDISHFVLDRLYGSEDPRSAGNHYELAELSPDDLGATAAGLPTHHWFDGRPLEEL